MHYFRLWKYVYWRFVICFSQHLALACAKSGSVSLSLSQAAESIFAKTLVEWSFFSLLELHKEMIMVQYLTLRY
jgi:hypothetical protein